MKSRTTTALLLFLVVAAFSGCSVHGKESVAAGDPGHVHYVIGCYILDANFTPIRGFPGKFCLFLDDGSFLSVEEPSRLAHVGPRGDVLWEKKIAVHHQLKLSGDGKRILTLSSVVRAGDLCKVRYDSFSVLDLATGKALGEWSSYEHRRELLDLNKSLRLSEVEPGLRARLDFDAEYTHFNSIQEIPENGTAGKLPAFAAGNLLVGLNGMGLFGILDRGLKRLIWTSKDASSPVEFHDAQVMSTGEILVYNNRTGTLDPGSKSGALSLEKIDPLSGSVTWKYPKNGGAPTVLESGGVQWLGDSVLFNVNSPDQGGVARLIDLAGNDLWTFPNPTHQPNGQPNVFQDIKRYDLSLFLKANRL